MCQQVRSVRAPFNSSNSRADLPLYRLSTDVCGPVDVQSRFKNRFFCTLLDDATAYAVVTPIRLKSQASDAVKSSYDHLHALTAGRFTTGRLRSDRGGEYIGASLQTWFRSKKILHETTSPDHPQQNGAAERLNRTLLEKSVALLLSSGLPRSMWEDALLQACDVYNMSLSARVSCSPHQALCGSLPNMAKIYPFGCRAFVNVSHSDRAKFKPRSDLGIYLQTIPSGFRVLLDSGSTIESKHVTFDAQSCPYLSVRSRLTAPTLQPDSASQVLSLNKTPAADLSSPSVTAEASPSERPRKRRLSIRTPRASVQLPTLPSSDVSAHQIASDDEPISPDIVPLRHFKFPFAFSARPGPPTYAAAMASPDADQWRAAIASELASHEALKTFELVDLPPGRKAIPSRLLCPFQWYGAVEITDKSGRLSIINRSGAPVRLPPCQGTTVAQ